MLWLNLKHVVVFFLHCADTVVVDVRVFALRNGRVAAPPFSRPPTCLLPAMTHSLVLQSYNDVMAI